MPIETKGPFALIIAPLSGELPEDYLEILNNDAAGKLDDVGEDPELAWVSGRHLLETEISQATSMLGGSLHINLRKAERKIPSSLLSAICRRDELAYMMANDTMNVPRQEKKRIREDAVKRNLMKMPPTISATTVAVDIQRNIMYAASSSLKTIDIIATLFMKEFNIEPRPVNVNELMLKLYGEETNQLPNVIFGGNTSSAEMDMTPGRDFLTWLWYYSETHQGEIQTDDGLFQMGIEGPLVFGFSSAEPRGAEESVVKKGCPQLSAEAKAALAVGKKLKKAKLTLARDQDIWSFTFDADKFIFSGLNLPEGDEMDPHGVFAERLDFIHELHMAIEAYFKKFADSITGPDHAEIERDIRDWAKNRESL